MKITINTLADELIQKQTLINESLYLSLGDCILKISSNSTVLIEKLRDYFSHIVSNEQPTDIEIIAIQSSNLDLPYEFVDLQREAGKMRRKDACFEFENGRLIKKVRTGMIFLQSVSHKIAAGDCLANDNQVINFINSQYMNWLQHRNWLICHAAGVVVNGQALAIAGFSGGGKSTLMLHLLNHSEFSYLTNDRLFIRREDDGQVKTCGIPKLPRINPGTLINNPSLQGMISDTQKETYLALDKNELWDLEDKYDVDVTEIYGKPPVTKNPPLAAFLVLNWQRSSDKMLAVEKVELSQRRDLLPAIMKSVGHFYQNSDGSFLDINEPLDEEAYLKVLKGITIYEVSGGLDFSKLVEYCCQKWK